MELTPEVIEKLGIIGVLGSFAILLWRKLESKDKRIDTMTDQLAQKYHENTTATIQNNQILIGLKELQREHILRLDSQGKIIERVDEFLRNGNNGK
jgi:hypothetical protein